MDQELADAVACAPGDAASAAYHQMAALFWVK